ncbi:hypothetical protein MA16_Dca022771 [Dendrobium catenatum]|uniref:Uncharacterized protein n=1 Tax=Dendrobium catenatum TaxID=906689 RepID=A0A2I0VV90_9ASPA|nr:hypothetical protein MA16_Dca022771 [Dendrobium catenatum]
MDVGSLTAAHRSSKSGFLPGDESSRDYLSISGIVEFTYNPPPLAPIFESTERTSRKIGSKRVLTNLFYDPMQVGGDSSLGQKRTPVGRRRQQPNSQSRSRRNLQAKGEENSSRLELNMQIQVLQQKNLSVVDEEICGGLNEEIGGGLAEEVGYDGEIGGVVLMGGYLIRGIMGWRAV